MISARAEASAAKSPTDQARARFASPMILGALSPASGSSRSQKGTCASGRASSSKRTGLRWVTRGNQLTDESDAKQQRRAHPGSPFAKQKTSLKIKGHGKQKVKNNGKANQLNAEGKNNDMGQDLARASPAEAGSCGR